MSRDAAKIQKKGAHRETSPTLKTQKHSSEHTAVAQQSGGQQHFTLTMTMTLNLVISIVQQLCSSTTSLSLFTEAFARLLFSSIFCYSKYIHILHIFIVKFNCLARVQCLSSFACNYFVFAYHLLHTSLNASLTFLFQLEKLCIHH